MNKTPRQTEVEIEAHKALAKLSEVYKILGDKRYYKVNKLIHALYGMRKERC